MHTTFSLFDIPIICLIVWAGIAPVHFYRTARIPVEHSSVWLPRIRWLALAAGILLVISRFLFGYLTKDFGSMMNTNG